MRALVESTQDLIWAVDRDFCLVFYNQAVAEYLSREYTESGPLFGLRAEDRFSPDRSSFLTNLDNRALTDGQFQIEYEGTGGVWTELSPNPITENGEIAGISVFCKGITECKGSELALKESEAR